MDENTVSSIKKFHFDHAFITVDGVEESFGYSINSRRQLPLYEYLVANSDSFVVLLDHSKFGKRAFARFASLPQVRKVLVDWAIPDAHLNSLRNAGADIIVAEPIEQ